MISELRSRVCLYLERQPELRRRAAQRCLAHGLRASLAILGFLRVPLAVLGALSGTDKALEHRYMEAYRRFFSPYRNKRITLLEIGVGGYDSASGGRSLRLWQAYFRRATIIGIDVHDKTSLSRGRVHVYQGSQIDREGLLEIVRRHGAIDLVIDDGSHLNQDQKETFRILFPLMSDRGVYVVEDTQTSYWPAYGGGSVGSEGYGKSAICMFKSLIDDLNHAEYLPTARAKAGLLKEMIRGMYFEHNLIFVLKGDNTGCSNFDVAANARELEVRSASPTGLLRTATWLGSRS
jgi:hypothetical protein